MKTKARPSRSFYSNSWILIPPLCLDLQEKLMGASSADCPCEETDGQMVAEDNHTYNMYFATVDTLLLFSMRPPGAASTGTT